MKRRKITMKDCSIIKAIFPLLVIWFLVGCSPKIIDVVTPPKKTVSVTFAGGGWRAHTGHSAWVMSLLAANNSNCALNRDAGNPNCLNAAFTNVNTISANSGGSWFSTMLMYDADFVSQITGKDAFENWGSSDSLNPHQGWLGRQNNYFASFNSKCGSDTGANYLECILENYFSTTGSTLPTPDWSQFVEKLVYKGYNWQSYGTLGSNNHLLWAKDKSLLIAGTWLTNAVVLNHMDDEIYYQVCRSPNQVKLDGDDGSWCTARQNGTRVSTPDILPVTFFSRAQSEPTLIAPSFIGTEASTFNLGYSGAYLTSGTTKYNTLQSGNNTTDAIPVMWAAAASSAAAGYSASYTVIEPHLPWKCDLTQWDCVYHLRNLALGFKIPSATDQVSFVPNSELDNLGIADLNDNRVIRIADGGAIDNSGIAQLVSFMQLNNQDTNFTIVAFDEVQSNDAIDKKSFPSSDISYLFHGAPANKVCVQGVCVNVPQLAILKLDPDSPHPITKHQWTVIGPNKEKTANHLYYYTYEVETIENSSFGIKAGSKGTIRVFASEFGCADTAPENKDDFRCYSTMLGDFKTTLRLPPDNFTSVKSGYVLLKEAFGL